MKAERRKKAESICAKIIAEYLRDLQEVYTDSYGIITLNRVKITDDTSYMDIYVSSQKQAHALTKELAQHAHKMTRSLGKQVAFMKVPKLRFRYDHGGKTMAHIYDTLSQVTWNSSL